jgi:hypothetical protein
MAEATPKRRDTTPWIAGGIVALVVLGALVAYAMGDPNDSAAPKRVGQAAATDVACSALARGQDALEAGQVDDVADSIKKARAAALHALDSGDARFGRAERLALQLGERRLETPLKESTANWIEDRLSAAEDICGQRRTS